jgi:hypothetical protein
MDVQKLQLQGKWNMEPVCKNMRKPEGTLFCTVSSLVTCNVLGKSIEERQDGDGIWDYGIME